MTIESDWLARIRGTMAIDVSRFMTAGLPPKAIVEKLFDIPEVAQAFHLRARSKLDIDIDTPEGQALAAERLRWAADFLDDGFNEPCVARIREAVGDIEETGC